MGVFAHVVAIGFGAINRLIISEFIEQITLYAPHPSFFERHSVVEKFTKIGQPERIRRHEPLIGYANERVGLHFLHIKIQRPHRLRAVHGQQRPERFSPF